MHLFSCAYDIRRRENIRRECDAALTAMRRETQAKIEEQLPLKAKQTKEAYDYIKQELKYQVGWESDASVSICDDLILTDGDSSFSPFSF